jgi:hypothetical protein
MARGLMQESGVQLPLVFRGPLRRVQRGRRHGASPCAKSRARGWARRVRAWRARPGGGRRFGKTCARRGTKAVRESEHIKALSRHSIEGVVHAGSQAKFLQWETSTCAMQTRRLPGILQIPRVCRPEDVMLLEFMRTYEKRQPCASASVCCPA